MLEFITNRFAKKETPIPETPPMGEIGFSNTLLYQTKDFPKYDPDRLKTWKGVKVYNDMMHDDQVKGVMEFKRHAVLSRDWFFNIKNDPETGEPDTQHEKMADVFGEIVSQMRGSFSDKLIGILSGIIQGYSINEKVYKDILIDDKTYWGLDDIKLRPHETFVNGFRVDDHGNIEDIVQTINSREITIPLSKVIHFVHQPDIDPHYGESDLRAAYRAYWSKDITIKFRNIFLERMAGGFVWAQVEGSLSPDQKTNLESLLSTITAGTGAYVPKNVELHVEYPKTTDAFEKGIAQDDKAIAKSVLVPNLLGITEQGNTGSYSQSQTQLEAFFWVLDHIANRLAECLNEQLFRELAIWNFGTEDFPPFTFEPISDEMKMEIAKTWAELLSKGAVTKTESDEDYLRRLLGFPEKTEEEEPEPMPEDEPTMPEGGFPDNDEWIDEQPIDNQEFIRKEFAEKPWLRRVDFARLESVLDDRDLRFTGDLNQIMGQIREKVEQQIIKIAGERSMGNVKPTEMNQVNIPPALVGQLRKTIKENLQATLDDGYVIAKKELPKKAMAKVIRPGMDKTQAEKFLAQKAMTIAGIIEQDVLNAVKRVLENAIKYDKNLAETIAALGKDTDLLLLLPETDAGGRAINIPARLENIARTNNADAINQARTALFGQPEFKGFVLAYEYSSVMDSRTSDICEHLNGKILKDFGSYTPPNHYQCRSILIPVTILDDWDGKESRKPTMEPQKGFA